MIETRQILYVCFFIAVLSLHIAHLWRTNTRSFLAVVVNWEMVYYGQQIDIGPTEKIWKHIKRCERDRFYSPQHHGRLLISFI